MPHDFLRAPHTLSEEYVPPPKPRVGRHVFKLGSALVFLFVLAIVAYFGGAIAVAGREAYEGKVSLTAAQEALSSKDFDAVSADLVLAGVHFARADRAIEPLRLFGKVPWVGAQVHAVDQLIQTARGTTDIVVSVIDVMKDVLSIQGEAADVTLDVPSAGSLATISQAEKRRILENLAGAAPKIREIDARVRSAIEEIERIPTSQLIGPLKDAIVPLKAKLAETRDELLPLVPFTEAIPAMAGYPKAKTYLVLLMNNTELRPGGGFISSFGVVKVDNGEIGHFQTEDIYALDRPSQGKFESIPPKPIVDFLGVRQLQVRDANWSPDFRTSSEIVLGLYEKERLAGRPDLPAVDGVIGMTPDIAVDMLRITGPITVDGVTFTPENLVEQLEFQVEQAFLTKGLAWERRKDIQVDLVEEVMNRLTHLPANQWSDGFKALHRALTEKHVLFYDADPKLQALYEANGWAGRTITTDGDYLRWVDANLGALKTDLVIDRRLAYSVATDAAGNRTATASMTYRNTGKFTYRTGRYRTYTRVFVPQGAELIKVTGSLKNDKTRNPRLEPAVNDTGTEGGLTWFGTFTAVEPGETRVLTFTYRLPKTIEPVVARGAYSLVVQKQLGTAAVPLTLDIALEKPIVSAEPAEAVADSSDSRYRLQTGLSVDRGFVLQLGP